MTTRFMNTTGIPLYKFNGETYCKLIDVVKLIHHESYEADNELFQRILDRMEMRITKNDFLLPDVKKPEKLQQDKFPGRYAVGRERDGKWVYYAESKDDKILFTDRPCMAQMYTTYRDASACADFIDGEDWAVLDFYDSMSEEDRWQRELRLPFPYDADEGNENSIPVQVVR